MMRLLPMLVAGSALADSATVSNQQFDASRLAVAYFECDVTPPQGHPLCGGWIKPVEAVDDPLLGKGIILADGEGRAVLCAVDWCLLQTDAYELLCGRIAEAAHVPRQNVAIHTVHQHNAPIADLRAQELLEEVSASVMHLDRGFLETTADRLASSVREALPRLQRVHQVGYGKARVEQFASNRRVPSEDGTILVRYSSTRDPVLQAAPEGLVDPWLRTVTFLSDSKPLVRLHYYATHPMSYYGDGRVTADTVGLARGQFQRAEGVPQIYFTGCAGNITAGKYNDGSLEARERLTGRIQDAMKRAVENTYVIKIGGVQWRTTEVELPPRAEPEWSAATHKAALTSPQAAPLEQLKAALNLAWLERSEESPKLWLSRLSLGPVILLHLPGECFVEYQLHAQAARPESFVAVAAYGEGGPGYICTDAAFAEGGYEPTMSRVGPPTEKLLKAAIARLLEP